MLHKTTLRTLAILLVFAASVSADSGHKFWAEGSVGYNTYELSDVNDELSLVGLDQVDGGLGIQFGAGFVVAPGWRVGAGLRYLAAKSDRSESGTSLEYDLPAMAYLGTFEFIRQTGSRHTVGLSGSVGVIQADGKVHLSVTGYGTIESKIKGNGLYAEARLVNEFAVADWLSIAPSVGYRLAKIGEVKVNDTILVKGDGEKYEMDYSGISLQVGIRVFFGGSSAAE